MKRADCCNTKHLERQTGAPLGKDRSRITVKGVDMVIDHS